MNLGERDRLRRQREDELADGQMPVWSHLDELRKRLVQSLLVVGVLSCVAYGFAEPVVRFLEQPLLRVLPPGEQHLYFTGIGDKFFVYLKVSLLVATCAAMPFLLWQLWKFVAPGLYRSERKAIAPFLALASLGFYTGLAFGYGIVLPTGYRFLIEFGGTTEKAIITLTEYFSLTLKLLFAMGLVFELPVIILVLVRLGMVSELQLRKFRRYAILGNTILAAILTPTPDAVTLLLVAVPLQLLYEMALFLARWFAPAPVESAA